MMTSINASRFALGLSLCIMLVLSSTRLSLRQTAEEKRGVRDSRGAHENELGFGDESGSSSEQLLQNEPIRRRLEDESFGHHKPDWTPVDCNELLQQVADQKVWDPNQGELLARWTITNPPFYVSLHQFDYDKMRRVIYTKGEYYEEKLTAVFQKILQHAPPNSRVVDVGGNIGWFTLVSAASGHHVDVFEPNKVNIIRQCQSKMLNMYENAQEDEILARTTKKPSINIFPYGVGSNTTTMRFYIPQNPGKASLRRDMLPKKKKPLFSTVQLIMLDEMAEALGWFEKNVVIWLLKVDVEGWEPPVFEGAKKLLNSHLVPNILMEVTGQKDNSENVQMMKLLLDAGYWLHRQGGTSGPDVPFDPAAAGTTPLHEYLIDRFASRHNLQINMWWKKTITV